MARCRDAIQNGRWAEVIGIVQGIAAKAQRIVEVGRATIDNASDQGYKTALSRAMEALERGIYTPSEHLLQSDITVVALNLQPSLRC